MSAKGLANDLGNYSSVKYDIQTSQCFVEGTSVLTKEGNKPIEEIQAGDFVYSTNPETGESGYKEVLRTFRKELDVIIHVFVNGEEIETTAVHPFWVENRWVSAKDLKAGDLLTLADGSAVRIARVYGEKLDEAVIVYNFEVEDFHTYYVTDVGVLVHNANAVDGCGIRGNKSGNDTTRVGRWMSENEYNKMFSTKQVQISGDNKVHVANLADIAVFGKQAPSGSIYVEFDVPSNTVFPGGKDGWGIIAGPGSLYDRLNAKKDYLL